MVIKGTSVKGNYHPLSFLHLSGRKPLMEVKQTGPENQLDRTC